MSAALDHGVLRPVQTAWLPGRLERPVGAIPGSVFHGSKNADLIASIAPLYLRGSVLDVTYGRGNWWRRYAPAQLVTHDLAIDGVDFRNLPEADRSFDAVCFDPPYVPRQGGDTLLRRLEGVYRERYGLQVSRSQREMNAMIFAGLAECGRVSRRWVLVKCTDYTNARRLRLFHVELIAEAERQGLRVHDLIVHASGTGPGGDQIQVIQRARRAHSYLLVFKVPARRRSA